MRYLINGQWRESEVEKKEEEKEWKCEQEEVYTHCPHSNARIIVQCKVFSKIRYMCGKKTEKEFFCYAIGKKNAMSTSYVVEDIVIPEQEVTYAGVDKITPISRPDIIGTIHKHPGENSPEFSSTDDQYMNYNMMIVTNSKGNKWNSMVKIKTKCGITMLVEPTLAIIEDNIDRHELKKQMKNIKEKTYGYQGSQGEFHSSTSKECEYKKGRYEQCPFMNYKTCDCVNTDCPYSDFKNAGATNNGNGYPETWDM